MDQPGQVFGGAEVRQIVLSYKGNSTPGRLHPTIRPTGARDSALSNAMILYLDGWDVPTSVGSPWDMWIASRLASALAWGGV